MHLLLLQSLKSLSLSFFFLFIENFVNAFADFNRFLEALLGFVLILEIVFVITVAHGVGHFFVVFNNFLKL